MFFREYSPYCISSRYFYDLPDRLPDSSSKFAAVDRPVPAHWSRKPVGMTVALRPAEVRLPEQGWKIHVSANLSNASQVIDLVWEYCIRKRIAFKFTRSRAAILAMNSKYWDRGASGKAMTIYPIDDAEFSSTLEALAPKLRGFAGPYILSDLRYENGPLFVRYGAFMPLWHVDGEGRRVPGIRTPDQSLVPDRREAVFSLPSFVSVPKIIQPLMQNPPGRFGDFPYDFENALHFSNGGGVYLGRSRTSGERVVLREARPFAGLDSNGTDAVTRLHNERAILSQLRGLDCTAQLVEYRKVWEHHFLVTRYVDGRPLLREIVERFPLVHPNPTDTEVAEYVKWAEEIFTRLQAALHDIHARGVRVCDIHPNNILVRPDGEITIIDFECATRLDDVSPPALGAPGFGPTAGLSAESADRYALDCVRLMLLLPIVPLLSLDPAKSQTLVSVACANLPVSPVVRRELASGLAAGNPDPTARDSAAEMFAADEPDWPSIRSSLVDGIIAVASPERDDRLFPGDPLLFSFGGATLGYGAAGVLLALAGAGAAVPTELVDWLSHAGSGRRGWSGVGLYDGPHGVAYALESLGARDAALKVLRDAASDEVVASPALFGGRSGIALSLLHFARLTGNGEMRLRGIRMGEEIARALLDQTLVTPAARPGLLHGATGPALLCLHLFEETGSSRFMEAAETALRLDLSAGDLLPDGAFHIRAGSRRLVYLDGGSAGIAMVLTRYLRHQTRTDLAATLKAIHMGCTIPFVAHPGLFQGRSGMIAALTHSPMAPQTRDAVAAQVRRLSWHAILHRGNLAFPGTGLSKLSYDLATGSAGILLTLQGAFGGEPVDLPFL